MQYKINSLEVYKSQEPIPQVAADVEAFDDDGNSLVHKTVILPAEMLDLTDDVIKTIINVEPKMQEEYLNKVIADKQAVEESWAIAQKSIDNVIVAKGKVEIGKAISVRPIDIKPMPVEKMFVDE
jgi:hypothetical protein